MNEPRGDRALPPPREAFALPDGRRRQHGVRSRLLSAAAVVCATVRGPLYDRARDRAGGVPVLCLHDLQACGLSHAGQCAARIRDLRELLPRQLCRELARAAVARRTGWGAADHRADWLHHRRDYRQLVLAQPRHLSRARAAMMRARRWRPSAEALALWAILLAALWLRLDGVAFGLPALHDPDEPLFMMTALEMLQKHSFDPGWFGHPGTITLYWLALVIAAVGGIGIATGRFADADALAAAVYADPGIVFLPARVMIVLCGVLCVWLTFRLGKRLGGARVGLGAAAILAVNAVHIEYSQIIRTDIQASVFMLLGALAAVGIAEQGRRRDYLLGGICAGLACATKWPAAAILVTAICAWAYRAPGERHWSRLAMVVAAAVITLFAVSPYLLIDHATVVANLSGEARPLHPGATGGGFFANLGWYVAGPLLSSLGVG